MFTVFSVYSNRELEDMMLSLKSDSTKSTIRAILDERYSR